MNMQVLALAFLATAAVGGIAGSRSVLSGERQAGRRAPRSRAPPAAKQAERASARAASRSKTRSRISRRGTTRRRTSRSRPLSQAGLDWTPQKFWIASASRRRIFFRGRCWRWRAARRGGLAFAGGFGLPRWALGFLKKRRENKFLEALPDAVDVIVRGIKAGLPLFESIKVVAADAPEPLRSEFLAIIETQAIGMPLGEACARLYDRMPLPEANFFGIVVSIQQKSGGNLSEALGNLSKVLRDRKKMREKIQAMSMEAKASAGIIGSLPPIVMFLVYLTTPGYISLLWTHPTGQLMLVGCVVWMSVGIMVMKKMINFDF